MKCTENAENLAAYLHDELTSYDEDTFQLHLSVCATCRDKHAKARDVLLRFQRVVPMEPSAIAREDLHRSIDSALRKFSAQSPLRFRDGSEVRWRRPFAAKPFALPLRRAPALPAPAEPAPNKMPVPPPSQSGINPLSPSARAVSARLNNITRRRSRIRVRKGFLLALAVTALAGLGYTYWYNRMAAHPTAKVAKITKDERMARLRWDERHTAYQRQHSSVASLLINRQADLNGIIEPSAVHALPHLDPHAGESCLVLYREDDTKSIVADEHYDAVSFKQALAASVEIVPVNGSVALPAQWIDNCIGPENRVVILKLENRLEIWSSARLERYLAAGPSFDSTLSSSATVSGLPTFKQ